MKDRILKIRKEAGLNQEDFAKKINLTKNYISLIETGNRVPSERTISDICREFNVRYEWLTDGIEPIYNELDTRIDAIMTGENEFAKNLFREFAKLDESEWKTLENLIKNIAKEKE